MWDLRKGWNNSRQTTNVHEPAPCWSLPGSTVGSVRKVIGWWNGKLRLRHRGNTPGLTS